MSKTKRPREARPQAAPEPLDTDALNQQIADMEQLLSSPGWQQLVAHANTQFGTRIVNDRITSFVLRAEREPAFAATFHGSVAYVTGGREAALLLLGLPGEIVRAAQAKLRAWHESQGGASSGTLGDGVELTSGKA